MTVNSTSSTAMAASTSFARRDSVGTGTGGRMATSALLQLHTSVAALPQTCPVRESGPRRDLRSSQHNAPEATGFPRPRQATPSRPAAAEGTSAGFGGAPRLEVGEGVQGVVEGGDASQRIT